LQVVFQKNKNFILAFHIARFGSRVSRNKLKTLHKYLLRQVIASMVMTVAVFTFVLLIGNVLKEILKLLISHQIGFGVAAEAIGLLIPFVWIFALPMGLLTATLLVFGRFSADQELTAARASGVSLISLVMPVLLLSLFCCGISAWINMELGPQCRATYVNLILNARSGLLNAQLPAGQFIRDFPGYIFYVEKNRGGDLENVTVFWSEHNTTIQAPRGRLESDVARKQLTLDLFDARSVTIMTNGSAVFTSVRDYPMTFDLNTATNRVSKPRISDMTFWQLRDELNDMERQLALPPVAVESSDELRDQLDEARKQRADLTEPIRVEMHREVAFSFACFGFALIGIPLGIRVHRRETNIGVAIALGLTAVYFSFMLVGKSLSGHPEWSPHLIFWLPNFIFQAVGAVLLWRANKGI
jgi:lipopolysaccharide export system permease protein